MLLQDTIKESNVQSLKPIICMAQIFSTMPLRTGRDLRKSIAAFSITSSILLVIGSYTFLVPLVALIGNQTSLFMVIDLKKVQEFALEFYGLMINVVKITNKLRTHDKVNKKEETDLMQFADPFFVTATGLGTYFVVLFKLSKKLSDFHHRLQRTDRLLYKVQSKSYLELNYKTNYFSKKSVMFIVTNCFLPVLYYTYRVYDSEGFTIAATWFSLLGVINLIVSTVDMQFINFANLFRLRFDVVSSIIREMSKNTEINERKNSLQESSSGNLIRSRNNSERLIISRNVSALTQKTQFEAQYLSTYAEIEVLRYYIQELFSLVEQLNSIYAVHLFFSVIGSVARVLFEVYFFLSGQLSFCGMYLPHRSYSVMLILSIWTYLWRTLALTIISYMVGNAVS